MASKKDNAILVNVGKTIRKERLKQNLTQNQLAFETNLTREFVNKVETGKYNISLLKLIKISDVLGIKMKEFF